MDSAMVNIVSENNAIEYEKKVQFIGLFLPLGTYN